MYTTAIVVVLLIVIAALIKRSNGLAAALVAAQEELATKPSQPIVITEDKKVWEERIREAFRLGYYAHAEGLVMKMKKRTILLGVMHKNRFSHSFTFHPISGLHAMFPEEKRVQPQRQQEPDYDSLPPLPEWQ